MAKGDYNSYLISKMKTFRNSSKHWYDEYKKKGGNKELEYSETKIINDRRIIMLQKYVVGKTENNKYFVRRVDSKIISEKLAYPIKPTSREFCIKELAKLAKKHPSILIMHDGLCGTTDTHQECIKIIVEAINPSENTEQYGDGELLEFHDSNNEYQFIVGRPEVSKAMLANNDKRTVDAMLEDYYLNFDEVGYIYDILPESDICMYRQMVN